ncbi:DNA polymerase III subunit gamma/tau [Oscillospiraceae bacterium MB08-C2-2]|nr:DNA polymerase III subunit gamma/tau [Oscillospiraceae bacterium MB08-C2-2]
MYQALYRKWRPKSFDDVVGQEHITTTLKNEIAAGKPSHAYLFTGTRGTGKTTCSKIIAKAVNCLEPHEGNPCGHCMICTGIDADNLMDVTEIDAASNSGVDNIRDLREEANFTPAVAKYRVYIIDEAHMLSTGAFNALLKIMEEPPAHVIFILATTEIHKVPATILSRCQRFDFRRIDSRIIADRLLYVAEQEGFALEEEAALLIAKLSDGGMRDALSLLDLCWSRSDSITPQVVAQSAGLTGSGHLFEISQGVIGGDIGAVLQVVEGLWAQSVDYERLCQQLIGFYRNMMVVKSLDDPGDLVACLPEELTQYREQAQKLSMSQILACLGTLQDAMGRMSRTTQRRTELELCLVKLCDPALSTAPEALLTRLEKLELEVKAKSIPQTAPVQMPVPAKPAVPAAEANPITAADKIKVQPFQRWNEVLQILQQKNKALYGALSDSSAYLGGDLVLVEANGDLFAQMVRGDSYAKDSLRQAILAVTGITCRLGPYNEAKYEKASAVSPVDLLLKKASELGVPVKES